MALRADTLPTLFWARVTAHGDRVAMREKQLGIWRPITWRQLGDRARRIGMGLVALGFGRGDRAAVLSNNRPEWVYADMGIAGAGGVCAGIYPTDSPASS